MKPVNSLPKTFKDNRKVIKDDAMIVVMKDCHKTH